jgi:hypothetical protein
MPLNLDAYKFTDNEVLELDDAQEYVLTARKTIDANNVGVRAKPGTLPKLTYLGAKNTSCFLFGYKRTGLELRGFEFASPTGGRLLTGDRSANIILHDILLQTPGTGGVMEGKAVKGVTIDGVKQTAIFEDYGFFLGAYEDAHTQPNMSVADTVVALGNAPARPTNPACRSTSRTSSLPSARSATASPNDTSAVQQAITAGIADNRAVYFPNGVYLCDTLTITARVWLIGESVGTAYPNMPGTGTASGAPGAALKMRTGTRQLRYSVGGNHNFHRIANLRFLGKGIADSGAANAIEFDTLTEDFHHFTMENVVFEDIAGYCWTNPSPIACYHINFKNIWLTAVKNGFKVYGGPGCSISNFYAIWIAKGGFGIDITNCRRRSHQRRHRRWDSGSARTSGPEQQPPPRAGTPARRPHRARQIQVHQLPLGGVVRRRAPHRRERLPDVRQLQDGRLPLRRDQRGRADRHPVGLRAGRRHVPDHQQPVHVGRGIQERHARPHGQLQLAGNLPSIKLIGTPRSVSGQGIPFLHYAFDSTDYAVAEDTADTLGYNVLGGGVKVRNAAGATYTALSIDGAAFVVGDISGYTTTRLLSPREFAFYSTTYGDYVGVIKQTGYINAAVGFQVGDVNVIGAQGAAVADATASTASNTAQINLILARLRAHGLIAT